MGIKTWCENTRLGGLRSFLRGPCPPPAQPGGVSRRPIPDSYGVRKLVNGRRIREGKGVGRGFALAGGDGRWVPAPARRNNP